MLRLEHEWVWDSWSIDHEGRHHLFFLKANRDLIDPDLRHFSPRIGHAVSTDWRTWTVLEDALAPSVGPSWDDATTWTGSVVQAPDGGFRMFYTGTSKAEDAKVQRIGRADSDDLLHWRRHGDQPVCEADPQWYEKYSPDIWHDEAWRDPWVFADPGGDGWHMLITARQRDGEPANRGVVGHAWSPDLDTWEVRPPLSGPGGFGQLEVLQWVPGGQGGLLVFNCGPREIDRAIHPDLDGGVFVLPAPSGLGPFDIVSATRVDHPSLYAARLITDVDGTLAWLGFSNQVGGDFVGEILDPIPMNPDTVRQATAS